MSDIKLSANAQQILDAVSNLTVLELADLIKAMEEKFGVTAAPAAIAMAPVAA
jgi:large subunit ribosomal protein L7/L12